MKSVAPPVAMDKSPDEMLAARGGPADCDMEDVLGYLNALQELEALDAVAGTSERFYSREGILLAAIVVYVRSFICSRTYGNADRKIDVVALKFFVGRDDLAALHDLLVDKRDKEVAHADWERHKSELRPMNKPGRTYRQNVRPRYQDGIATAAFIELVDHVQRGLQLVTFNADRRTLDRR